MHSKTIQYTKFKHIYKFNREQNMLNSNNLKTVFSKFTSP